MLLKALFISSLSSIFLNLLLRSPLLCTALSLQLIVDCEFKWLGISVSRLSFHSLFPFAFIYKINDFVKYVNISFKCYVDCSFNGHIEIGGDELLHRLL